MNVYLIVYEERIGNRCRKVDTIVLSSGSKSEALNQLIDTVDGVFTLVRITPLKHEDIFYLRSEEI